jgi:hypothetical protein
MTCSIAVTPPLQPDGPATIIAAQRAMGSDPPDVFLVRPSAPAPSPPSTPLADELVLIEDVLEGEDEDEDVVASASSGFRGHSAAPFPNSSTLSLYATPFLSRGHGGTTQGSSLGQ